MLFSRCYLRKHIQNCMCLWKIVSRMLKEKYKWYIPISKVFMRERKKNLRTISHCLIFQPFFIGSLNQNVLCQKRNKFHYDPSFLKYEDYFWTITIYLPYTICRTIIDLVLFIIVDELQNIKKHQDQKIL